MSDLQQKLGNRAWVSAFLLTQCISLLLTLASGFAVQSGWLFWASQGDALFLILCGIIFLISIPLRAISNFSEKIDASIFPNTSGLSRIVWREWMYGLFWTMLYGVSLFPYILLRQILGAYEIFHSLESFGLICLSGMLLMALALCLIAYRFTSVWILQTCLVLITFVTLFQIVRFSESSAALISWKAIVLLYINAGLLVGVFLEAGESQLALVERRHVITKRFLALTALIVAAVFARLGIPAGFSYTAAAIVVYCVLMDGFFESPSTYLICFRGKLLGSLRSIFFSQGWISASCFALFIFLISLTVLYWERVSRDGRLALAFAASFAIVIWPAALIHFFLPKTKRFATYYWLFQAAGTAFALLCYWMPFRTGGPWDVSVSFFPLAVFFLTVTKNLPPTGLDIYLWISTILCCLSFLLLFARVLLLRWNKSEV